MLRPHENDSTKHYWKMPVLINFNFQLIFPEPNIDVLFQYNNTYFKYKIQPYAKLYNMLFSGELLSCSLSPQYHLCDCQGVAFWARDGGREAPIITGFSSSRDGVSPLFLSQPVPSQGNLGIQLAYKVWRTRPSNITAQYLAQRLVALFSNPCAALGVRTSRTSHCGKIA